MSNSSDSTKLVWYDQCIFNDANKELLKRLEDIFGRCDTFVERDQFEKFFTAGRTNARRYILIISGKLGKDFIPEMDAATFNPLSFARDHIFSIYVYCGDKEYHEKWAAKYEPKVKVTNSPDELIKKIREDMKIPSRR